MIPIRIGAFIPAKPTYSESQGNLVKILDASGSSGKDLRMRTKSRDPVIPGPCFWLLRYYDNNSKQPQSSGLLGNLQFASYISSSFEDYSNSMLFLVDKLLCHSAIFASNPMAPQETVPKRKRPGSNPGPLARCISEARAKAPSLPRPLRRNGRRTEGRTWADS